MAPFKPQVACVGTVNTPPSSWRYIMDEMFKGPIIKELFGHATDSQVTIALPLTLQARKQDLRYRILLSQHFLLG